MNKLFKDHLTQLYSEWFLRANHPLTPTGRMTKPSVTALCQRIITAWQRISPEVNMKDFEKCCVSNVLEGNNDILWNDSEEDGNVSSVTDCKGGNSNTHW